MDYVSEALHSGQERMDRMEANIAANTEAILANVASTEAHRAETREMVEAFNAAKGGLKTLETIGKVFKVVGAIGLGISAAVGAYHTVMKFFK